MATTELDNYKLAFEQSSKALTSQVGTVDNARARIGLLMGSGNLATAFLGKEAISHASTVNGIDLGFWAGAIAYILFVAACLWGLWPSGEWVFSLSAKSILDRQDRQPPESMESTYRYLAEWQEQYFDANAHRLDRLFLAIQVATVLIAIEMISFTALVGGFAWIIKP